MTGIRVLQLTSSMEPFFRQQVDVLEEHGVDCTTLPVPGTARGDESRNVRNYAKFYRRTIAECRNDYDLVHVNYGLIGPIGLAQPIRPVVLTLWGSEVMGYSSPVDRLSRFAARRSDAVIAPSVAVSERLDCSHRVVPFGVDLDLFKPIDRREAREYLGWSQNDRIVLFPYDPGRTVKNHALARSVIDRTSVNAELKTVSGLPYHEMPYVMNACDAVLVTSRRESGPMVVREAAACNVPVVSTDVGFVSETLENVENSYVTDAESELVEAVDSVLRSVGRSNGREIVEQYDTERMGSELLSVYVDALDGESSDPRRVEPN